jgi:hypothetical protein
MKGCAAGVYDANSALGPSRRKNVHFFDTY